MIVCEHEQGTLEWKQDRAGVATASMFAECRRRVDGLTEKQQTFVTARLAGKPLDECLEIAQYKAEPKALAVQKALDGEPVGDFTTKAKQYAFRLAIERISGELLDDTGFKTPYMHRGQRLEDDARLLHEQRKGILVEQVGLILTDDRRFGVSLDGMIDDDGTSEYKAFLAPETLMPILLEGKMEGCADQVQGGLWITGRQWSDFVLYCPALRSINRHLEIITTWRDDIYIQSLAKDMEKFDALVEQYKEKLINGGKVEEVIAPEPEEQSAYGIFGG